MPKEHWKDLPGRANRDMNQEETNERLNPKGEVEGSPGRAEDVTVQEIPTEAKYTGGNPKNRSILSKGPVERWKLSDREL